MACSQSAATVFKLSVLGDGQLGGVARGQAGGQAGRTVALLHLCQRRHQSGVGCIQGANPSFLIGQKTGSE